MNIWENILKKLLLVLFFIPSLLFSYSDSDLDGVSDKNDLCPNSTMLDIVDRTGCTIEKLVLPPKKSTHFDIIIGTNYSKMGKNDKWNLNESLQFDYYYQNLIFQLQSSNYEEAGLGDTTLGAYYKLHPSSKLSVTLGTQVILPTYQNDLDNNNVDYKLSTSLNYQLDKISLFMGGSYSLINDDDINGSNYTIEYQNSHGFYVGIGSYLFPELYSSLIVSEGLSTCKGGEDIKNISFYNHYRIDKSWFSRFGYTEGLNNSSANQFFLNLGYYF
jgi:hypothetical protein